MAKQSNHDIAIILKENSIQLPTGETTSFSNTADEFPLNLFVLTVDRAVDFCTQSIQDVVQPLV
jgi:hypothetical protein